MMTLQGLNLSLTASVREAALGAAVSTLSGCFSEAPDLSGTESIGGTSGSSSAGTAGTEGSSGASETEGIDSTGGSSGGEEPGVVPGAQYIPNPLRPAQSAVLPSTWAYALWQPGTVPVEKSLEAYEICRTDGDISQIDDASECPNAEVVGDIVHVLEPLASGATYYWKLRAVYADGWTSEFSSVQSFSTDASLIGRWKFEGDLRDETPAGHDGEAQTETYAPGFVGQALSLDGADEYATVADADVLDFAGDFAISAWVYPQTDGEAEALIAKRSASNGFELYRTSGGVLAFFSGDCGDAVVAGELPSNAWRHVAAKRSGASVSLYVQGALAGTGNCTENFANEAVLSFGCNGPDVGCGEKFNGRLDEIGLYGAALSEGSIINDFCAAQALSGGTLPPACQ